MVVLYIFLGVIAIIILFTFGSSILDHFKYKANARKEVYRPLESEPTYKKIFINGQSSYEQENILNALNDFNNYKMLISFLDNREKDLNKKIELAAKWHFTIIDSLKSELSNTKIRKKSIEDSMKNCHPSFIDKSSNYINAYKNEMKYLEERDVVSFFGKVKGYVAENKYVIFYKHVIVFLDNKFTDIKCFDYSQLKLSYELKTITKNRSVLPNDEIIGYTWLHPRNNGQPDMRYSTNYKIYKVRKYNLYFDRMRNYGYICDTEDVAKKHVYLFRVAHEVLDEKNDIKSRDTVKNDVKPQKETEGIKKSDVSAINEKIEKFSLDSNKSILDNKKDSIEKHEGDNKALESIDNKIIEASEEKVTGTKILLLSSLLSNKRKFYNHKTFGILDVLQNYTTYNTYCRIKNINESDK